MIRIVKHQTFYMLQSVNKSTDTSEFYQNTADVYVFMGNLKIQNLLVFYYLCDRTFIWIVNDLNHKQVDHITENSIAIIFRSHETLHVQLIVSRSNRSQSDTNYNFGSVCRLHLYLHIFLMNNLSLYPPTFLLNSIFIQKGACFIY